VIVGIAQIAPVFLDRAATLAKVVRAIEDAAAAGARLVCFPEAIVPGYPVWVDRTGGAKFDDPRQKQLYALYLEQAVDVARGDLALVCEAAKARAVDVVLGVAERAADRGGHSIYCSRVFIDDGGRVRSVHRKLVPTYEERLVWAPGDGAGLVTHRVGEFTVGALNCWENWMPMARAALHGLGEDLHVALWPGNVRNTANSTCAFAFEGRSYVVSASGLLRDADIPRAVPFRDAIVRPGETLHDGGSAVAGPDGKWVLEPVVDDERVLAVDLDPVRVGQERQNFDASGHYSRPDVLSLRVNRARQRTVAFDDEE
jgi:nitrilase